MILWHFTHSGTGIVRKNSTQFKVFSLLSDQKWHCRECEGKKIGSKQYAGRGGIQGLESGNRSRPGLEIITEKRYCETCQSSCYGDRWNGSIKSANSPANLPKSLIAKILKIYNYTDTIEQSKRPTHELIIDHRFPMERWQSSEPKHDLNMSETEIRQKFQVLKKDLSGNHNLLKSRSCEKCIETGKRGTPLGIKFWYSGTENWPDDIPQKGPEAEQGCVGCGWYDFELWRNELNQKLADCELND